MVNFFFTIVQKQVNEGWVLFQQSAGTYLS